MPDRQLRSLLIASIFLLSIHPMASHASSFDCKKAKSSAEKLICSDVTLSKLDEELATVYLQALALAPDQGVLKKEQRDWVKKSRNGCTNVNCLSSSYNARISTLKQRTTPSSAMGIIGTWEVLKPDAGGPFRLHITKTRLQFGSCKRVFELRGMIEKEFIFAAAQKGTCGQFSDRFQLNVIKVSITDDETIHATFYSGNEEKDWLGSNNFFNVE